MPPHASQVLGLGRLGLPSVFFDNPLILKRLLYIAATASTFTVEIMSGDA
jgi:hypothetical protein